MANISGCHIKVLDFHKKKRIEDITWKFWRLDKGVKTKKGMEEEKEGIGKVGPRLGNCWHYAHFRAEERTASQMFWRQRAFLFTIRLLCVISIESALTHCTVLSISSLFL